jgi:hypothetical protein
VNNIYTIQHFERNKNIKAFAFTVLITLLLFLIFFYIEWNIPQTPVPTVDEGIEVNLGNSETGLGDIAPQLPGTPSNAEQTNISPPPAATTAQQNNITPADPANEDDIATANKTKAVVKNKPLHNENKTVKKLIPTTFSNPTPPAPPKPKALYKGGTTNGNGGNYADSYNGVQNQGIAGGKGDQGNPNGNPNSDSYTGTSASGHGSGVSIRSGLNGRGFAKLPSFQDDFNENAKVAIDITVDAGGNVSNAILNLTGTTTTNSNIRNIALKKARQLKLTHGNEEQTGTIVFNFKVTN